MTTEYEKKVWADFLDDIPMLITLKEERWLKQFILQVIKEVREDEMKRILKLLRQKKNSKGYKETDIEKATIAKRHWNKCLAFIEEVIIKSPQHKE